jgi:hypothetical protein
MDFRHGFFRLLEFISHSQEFTCVARCPEFGCGGGQAIWNSHSEAMMGSERSGTCQGVARWRAAIRSSPGSASSVGRQCRFGRLGDQVEGTFPRHREPLAEL